MMKIQYPPIETERLLLLPGKTRRDEPAFLKMLKEDGDFEIFSGVPFSEKNLRAFGGYLQRPFCFAIYRGDRPGELLGCVGVSRRQYRSETEPYEAEFYVKKSERRRGYAEEALRAVCKEAFSGRLRLEELRAATTKNNFPAMALLEKCGFTIPADGPILAFTLLTDAEGVDRLVGIMEYVLKKDQEAV